MQIHKLTPPAPVQAAAPAQVLWTTIGAAWEKLDKKGRKMLTIKIGNTKQGIDNITLTANDCLFLRANTKRPNMPKDPDYQLCVNA